MKKIVYAAVLSCFTGAIVLPVAGFAANVCSDGVGIPPFLSSGAKPNLLMVLDNSGSMLDAAYSTESSFCFDDNYITDKPYAGYFKNDQWYEWDAGDFTPWVSGKGYTIGNRVYVQGVLWEALGTGTSNGTSPIDDRGLAWQRVFTIGKWKNATTYTASTFVWSGPQLYYTAGGGTSNDSDASNGLSLEGDTDIKDWKAVDSTWLKGKSYKAKDIVTYRGILYEATNNATSDGTGVYDDTKVTWKPLDEGSFVAVSSATALSDCSSATGATDKFTQADLCISLNKSSTPAQVVTFAARGNLLNWATASKFDVEKGILTGGKYDYKDQILIGEHRGCAGSRMVKQVPVTDASSVTKYLSLGVRASRYNDQPLYEDRIDSTDDTGRLEVLGVTDSSYSLSTDCQSAIDKIINHGLNGSQNQVEACIISFPNSNSQLVDMRPTLNHSLQACWQSALNKGHWDTLIADCYALYTGGRNGSFTPARPYDPSELRPADGGPYLCYGIYDSGVDPNNRVGYMGRCWIQGGGGWVEKYCNQLTTTVAGSASLGASTCWDYNNKSVPTTESLCQHYRNNGGFVEQCTVTYSNGDKKSVCPNGSWKKIGKWDDGSGSCDYPQNPQQVCPPNTSCDGTWEVTSWPNWQPSDGNCIFEAIKDYCDALKVPEVIDPSDVAGTTGETGNMPGLLRDSYLMAFLGGEDPIATMKAHIYQKNRPQGIVHRVASDLRLGLMSFRYVGAKTECALAAADTTSKIDKYCPLENKDGADLLTPLEVGDYVTDDNDPTYESGKRRHVDDLAEAINTTRGTSWTPLAEAAYEALGYYTQNINFCLNKDSNTGECMDFPTADNPTYFPTITKADPVQYWCQDNHILVITEGESTADVNADVANFSVSPLPSSDSHILSSACPSGCTANGNTGCLPNDLAGDGDTNPDCTTDGLYSSAYLDNMTWWGQHVQPLYQNRCVSDASGQIKTEKQAIYTHVVTTGSLTSGGTGECSPATLMTNAAFNGGTDNYYPGEDPAQLERNLYAVLDDILSRSSAGSAASVISSSRSGSGAVYQAVFWPKFEDGDPDGDGVSNKVTWVGDVHSLFVDSKGLMYEDTNQDGELDTTADKRVVFYFSNAANKTRGCYNVTAMINNNGQCPEPAATTNNLVPECTDGDDCVELQNIKYLWSANERLADRDLATKSRKLFTWNDLNNDGIVEATDGEWFQLNNSVDWTALNTAAATAGNRGPVTKDFLKSEDWEDFVGYDANKTSAEMEKDALNALVQWLQGVDSLTDEVTTDDNGNGWLDKELRSRKFTFKTQNGNLSGWADKTWRLGDIIHSTPMVVAKPAESYHYIYRDPTYASFAAHWSNRRNMIYFGGNDGMLHAVNGGFYFDNKFCCTGEVNADGSCKVSPTGGCGTHPVWSSVELGDELWAYIPYNLQPHLKCLADKYYAHKAYVDLKPRIFDAQIFKKDDTDHVGGWGTILVGAMRFGGTPVLASELNGDPNDKRKFVSSYFILDITNPENEPILLGEMTQLVDANGQDVYANMQYTTASPAMIIMRDGGANAAKSQWELVLGSGPSDLGGINGSNVHGKLAIVPLDWLEGNVTSWSNGMPTAVSSAGKKAFRIPNEAPKTGTEGGFFEIPLGDDPTTSAVDQTTSGFVSDIISVDYNIDLSADDGLGARYRTDAVYFGTVDGSDFTKYPADYLNGAADQFYWKGGGRVFRLVTKMLNTNGEEIASLPSEWADKWTDKDPLRLLADVKMPVVGAPSIGYDDWNYWVYAGTGRFYGEKDKTDDGWCTKSTDTSCADRSKMAIFGFKEPLMDELSGFDNWASPPSSSLFTCDDKVMTWATINWDINKKANSQLLHNGIVGERGLMQTDNILVQQGAEGYLYCYHCVTDPTDPAVYSCSKLADTQCFPSDIPMETVTVTDPITGISQDVERYTFDNLNWYISGDYFNPNASAVSGCTTDSNGKKIETGLDGWYRAFHDARERNLGASALLGGLLTFTTYQPYNDRCKAEGQSYLYGVHFQTGTAWTESVFGTFDESLVDNNGTNQTVTIVKDKLGLGRGLSTTPSMHVGSDSDNAAKAFIQTSTGEIIEVEQKNLPYKNTRSGRQNWTDRRSSDE